MSADEMCGDYPAPCNCDDPETHDGAVTAADRPSVTDNARDEEPLAWCPGCGDRIPTRVVRERGVCSECWGTRDDPWAAGRTDRPSATDNARAVREAAMDLYRALRRTNPDALAEVDEVEDWTYWEDIVRTAQVTLAADRPTVTDNARAEAERRWPHGEYRDPLMRGAMREKQRAFVAGAEWAAGRAETTTATVEDTARAIHRALAPRWMSVAQALGPDQDAYEAMLADIAKSLADAGLLATARTRPTREQIIDALVMSPLSDTAGTDMRPFEQTADAVLALYADQPTEAEAGARALEDAADEFEAIEQRYAIVHSPVAWLRERADRTRDGAR